MKRDKCVIWLLFQIASKNYFCQWPFVTHSLYCYKIALLKDKRNESNNNLFLAIKTITHYEYSIKGHFLEDRPKFNITYSLPMTYTMIHHEYIKGLIHCWSHLPSIITGIYS